MNHQWCWQCPLCSEEIGYFARHTKLGLHVAVAEHILHAHEEPAAQRAVDRARLECTQTECSLGCRKKYDVSDANMVPKMTEYDMKFLSGVKVKIE
jgi:hypothetical protein